MFYNVLKYDLLKILRDANCVAKLHNAKFFKIIVINSLYVKSIYYL